MKRSHIYCWKRRGFIISSVLKSLRRLEVQESRRRWKAFVKHLHSPGFLWPGGTPGPNQITAFFLSLSLSIFLWDRKVNPAVIWFCAEMVSGSRRRKQKTSGVRDGGRIIRLVTESASLLDYHFFPPFSARSPNTVFLSSGTICTPPPWWHSLASFSGQRGGVIKAFIIVLLISLEGETWKSPNKEKCV